VTPHELWEGLMDKKKLRILKTFVQRPGEKFYLRELSKEAGVPPATTYRILKELLTLRLVRVDVVKKSKLYCLEDNEKARLLRDVLEDKKNAVQEFVERVSAVRGVEKIVLHGKESRSKANILIIGRGVDSSACKAVVGEVKEKYGVSIIELTLTPEQFQQMSAMGLFPGEKKTLWQR